MVWYQIINVMLQVTGKVFLWSQTSPSFCFYLLCAQSSQFSLHLSTTFLGPKLMFWVGEGRGRRGMQSKFRCIPPWLELLFSGSEYDTLLQIFFETRFCCYLLGKGRRDGANEGSMPSSSLPLWLLDSTNKRDIWSN